MADDNCDYCYEPGARLMRPIGFTTLEDPEKRYPLVKMWCGKCEADDVMDPEASVALHQHLRRS